MPIRPRSFLERQRDAGRLKEQRRAPDGRRGRSADYGHRWRQLRLVVLHRDPICKACNRAPSTEADHIVARAKGGTDSMDNLQGLCCGCHSRKTAREDGSFGRRPTYDDQKAVSPHISREKT